MLTNSRLAYQHHDHDRCINAALQRAHDLCKANKARLTPIREAVFRAIWAGHRPLGAYDIVEYMSNENPISDENSLSNENQAKKIQAPTVYRAVDFLMEQGLIHRIASLNAYIGCPFPGNHHSHFFLICQKCHAVAECSTEHLNTMISNTVERTGFHIETQAIEIHGLCLNCKEHSEPKAALGHKKDSQQSTKTNSPTHLP